MERLLKEKDAAYIKDLFEKNLKDDVTLTLFFETNGEKITKFNEQYLPYTEEIVKEVAELSPKIKLNIYKDDVEKEKEYGVKAISALFIEGSKTNKNIVYYGIPSGHEFSSLLEDIVDVSKGETELPVDIKEKVRKISSPVEILVFVTPTCPYCPRAVRTAHQFALENPNIIGAMIEANEFPDWSNEFNVYAVPKVVINGGKAEFEGALPEDAFLQSVYEALGIKLI
ncbi:protein disulfide oxidoreductase [Caldisericum exile]|uniref:Protein-disulfide reductase n=1 Tax=Caldisericum exile (strain DSM 21853 / NBRC 104410 / AZM16c01) TaxID=511051 RepID=A0A7U6GEU1_CALEA|nr:thioredoxin family protein [Caldisericum exile]BAL81092.1 protein-disulfide reductase [Caldisericum exile AZM16c01]